MSNHFESALQRQDRMAMQTALDDGYYPQPPPAANPEKYNAGLGAAGPVFGPQKPPDDPRIFRGTPAEFFDDTAWKMIAYGFDANCGMEDRAVFERRLLKACFIDDYRRSLDPGPGEDLSPAEIAIMKRELATIKREWRAWEIIGRLEMKRKQGYWSKPPQPGKYESANEAHPAPQKLRVWRNGTELINPRWEPAILAGYNDLAFEVDWGLGVSGSRNPTTGRINSVMIEHLLKSYGLKIEGDMPDWIREIIRQRDEEHPPQPETATANPMLEEAREDNREQKLEAAAEARAEIPRRDIDHLFKEIQYAVDHPHMVEAHALHMGFEVEIKPMEVRVVHPNLAGIWTVASRLDLKESMRLVIKRADVIAMLKALGNSTHVRNAARKPQVAPSGPVPIAQVVQAVAANMTAAQNRKINLRGKDDRNVRKVGVPPHEQEIIGL